MENEKLHDSESKRDNVTRRKYLQLGATATVGVSSLAAIDEYVGEATAVSTTDPSPSDSEIGGGAQYNNDITRSDATTIVSNKSGLKTALGNASSGDVVWVESFASIDMTGESNITIPSGVTLASGRGIGGSQGALLHVDDGMNDEILFKCSYKNDVRVTGIQLRGPFPGGYFDPPADPYDPGFVDKMSTGIFIYNTESNRNVEIDNCHLWGWTVAAARIGANANGGTHCPTGTHVHHCSIHTNAMEHLGYGIDLLNGDEHLIEYCYFDLNRHCIDGFGNPDNGYEARYNIVDDQTISHAFDMHNWASNNGDRDVAGSTINIHHNTFRYTNEVQGDSDEYRDGSPQEYIKIREAPDNRCDMDNNWFQHKDKPPAGTTGGDNYAYTQTGVSSWTNMYESNNAFGPEEPPSNIGAPRDSDGGGTIGTARETGYVTIDNSTGSAWFTESLNHTFNNPVAFLKPFTHNGNTPVHARIRNVGSTSFDMTLEEWDYSDGTHVTETGHFFVVDQGSYISSNDVPYEAGTVTADENWASVTFNQDFSSTPVVFTQSQTYNGPNAIITRTRNVSTSGFDTRVYEQESLNGQGHNDEEIGYFAIEPGTADFGDATVEVGTTTADSSWTAIGFDGTFDGTQRFLASVQTHSGGNSINIRRRNLDSTGVEIFLEEETSADSETTHNTETVGYLVTTTSASF